MQGDVEVRKGIKSLDGATLRKLNGSHPRLETPTFGFGSIKVFTIGEVEFRCSVA